MSDFELVKNSHPVLLAHAMYVPQGENVNQLINRMRCVMLAGDRSGPGLGLAANQVDVLKRVIVLAVDGFHKNIINPEITRWFGGRSGLKEGCLSFPGLLVMKVRHNQIVVEGFNENWNPVRYKLKGMAARVVQHEVDHLNGITINQARANTEGARTMIKTSDVIAG